MINYQSMLRRAHLKNHTSLYTLPRMYLWENHIRKLLANNIINNWFTFHAIYTFSHPFSFVSVLYIILTLILDYEKKSFQNINSFFYAAFFAHYTLIASKFSFKIHKIFVYSLFFSCYNTEKRWCFCNIYTKARKKKTKINDLRYRF